MKRLTDEELNKIQNIAINRYSAGSEGNAFDVGYFTKSIAASNIIIIELLQRQMEGKK